MPMGNVWLTVEPFCRLLEESWLANDEKACWSEDTNWFSYCWPVYGMYHMTNPDTMDAVILKMSSIPMISDTASSLRSLGLLILSAYTSSTSASRYSMLTENAVMTLYE